MLAVEGLDPTSVVIMCPVRAARESEWRPEAAELHPSVASRPAVSRCWPPQQGEARAGADNMSAGQTFPVAGGPAPADPGATPTALAQVIPGGFVAASQAIREQIDGARRRLDVMNPYLTDRDILERILAAARRGVRVRLVVSATSNNAQATAALRHRYDDLIEAGVEIWELPGTVVHAKVVVADDVVSFGTVNLDSWALYRNSEIAMVTRSAEAAALLEDACSSRTSPARAAASRRPASSRGSRPGSGTSPRTSSERAAAPQPRPNSSDHVAAPQRAQPTVLAPRPA